MKVLILAALALTSFALPFAAQGNSAPTLTNGSKWEASGGYAMTAHTTYSPIHNTATFQAEDSSGLSRPASATPGPGGSIVNSGTVHTNQNSYRARRGRPQVYLPATDTWKNMRPVRATHSADDNPGGCPGPWGSDDVTTSPGPNIPFVPWSI